MHLITLNYTEIPYISQPYASKPKNLVDELVFLWVGSMTIDPAADYWTDTETRPPVQVDLGPSENFWNIILEDMIPWETEWGSWETTWTGEPFSSGADTVVNLEAQNWIDTGDQSLTEFLSDIDPTRLFPRAWAGSEVFDFTVAELWMQETEQTRTGVRNSLSVETQQTDLGTRVIDNFLQPFMRSRDLNIYATNMKPSTRVYVHFDGLPAASANVRPALGSFGDPVVTDSNGNAIIVYRIPPATFHTGTREVVVSDDPQNRPGFVTTTCKKSFTAMGLGQIVESTIVSTAVPEIVQEELQEVETTVELTEWWRIKDPIAQSFVVESRDGMFLTSMDLFFYEKSSTNGVKVQIREMRNGQPTNVLIPYGESHVAADSVLVSNDATLPTTFEFDDPVFLMNDTEYCFVVIPDSYDKSYRLWVSELGEFDITTGKRIAEQPNDGILFTSSNDRSWTPHQSEDIKFSLKKASFATNVSGTVVLEKPTTESFSIADVSGTFVENEEVKGLSYITISNALEAALDLNDSDPITIGGTVYTVLDVSQFPVLKLDTYDSFSGGETFNDNSLNEWVLTGPSTQGIGKIKLVRPTELMELYESNGQFVEGDDIKGTESGATATLSAFLDYKIHMIHPIVASFTPSNTKLSWEFRSFIDGSLTLSDWIPINGNFDNEFKTGYLAVPRSSEVANLSGQKSVQIRATLTSDNPNVSPVLDKSRMGALITENWINDPVDLLSEEYDGEGLAYSKCVTKAISFAEGQDAEDLKVYLTAYKPYVSDIAVFYKVIHAEDVTKISDRNWVQMEPFRNVWDDRKFIELEYNIPEAEKNVDGVVEYTQSGGSFTGFKTMLIKIVLTSSNPAIYPIVKNMRAIGLQL